MARRETPVHRVDVEPELHCSVEDQRRLLGASPFFASLAPGEVDDVQRAFRQQHYHEGDSIQYAGDPADRLSLVAAGTVKLARPTPDGQDVVMEFVGAGHHFGSLADLGDAAYREDATAQTNCCVLYTTSDVFHQLMERYPTVAIAALKQTSERLRHAQSVVEQLSAYPVEHRVAATLLQLASQHGRQEESGVLISIPLSRQDVADMTGATVESVSRVLSDFRRRGLIDSGRKWIGIPDPAALEAIVGR